MPRSCRMPCYGPLRPEKPPSHRAGRKHDRRQSKLSGAQFPPGCSECFPHVRGGTQEQETLLFDDESSGLSARNIQKPASGGGSRPSEKAGETPDPPGAVPAFSAARLPRRAGGTLYAPPGQERITLRRTFRAGLSGLRPALPSLRIRPAARHRTPWRPSPRRRRSRACGRCGGTPQAYDAHHARRAC